MRTYKLIILVIFFNMQVFISASQENGNTSSCKVLKPEIAQKYEGECKNGLAHGKGVASGTDTYTGSFKRGLPNGKGTYKYADGSVYIGDFVRGLRSGYGKHTYKINNRDSIQDGVWREDKYQGKKLDRGYEVILSHGIDRYQIRKLSPSPNQVVIKFNVSGSLSGVVLDVTPSTQINVGGCAGYENYNLPFEGRITYYTQNKLKTATIDCEFRFKITAPGYWEVVLNN